MPLFAYQARDDFGAAVNGVMAAESEEGLADSLRERDLYLVRATPRREEQRKFSARGVQRRDLVVFSLHLATVLAAGIPIAEGLQDLERQTANANFKEVIRRIREDLLGGSSLSQALSRYPQVFPDIYVNLVRAGESTGMVDMILRELISFLEWQQEIVSTTKRVTFYPAVIFCSIAVLVGIIFTIVFPRVMPIFEGLGVPLPLITRVMIGLSRFFRGYWPYLLLAAGGSIIAVRLIRRTPRGQLFLDGLKLRIPIFGDLISKIAFSRLSHHLGTMLRAGVNIIESLTTVQRVVGNAVIARAIGQVRERVIAGGSLWQSFQATGIFPPLVIRMIAIGETSGSLEETLGKVSEYYDRDVPDTIKRIFSVLEPLLIMFLALCVVCIALSFYLPLYSSLSRITAGR